MIECSLVSSETQTAYGPLCAFGHHLTRNEVLKPLEWVDVRQKTVDHSPAQKLADALIGILAGCSALYELNVRVRPDVPLRRAFGREDGCAEQSTVSDTLDAFDEGTVAQLREAVGEIQRRHCEVFRHDFGREMLVSEVDLTGLSASGSAEGGTKGYFPNKRNKRGRQPARVIAPQYKEAIFEELYPGKTNSSEVLKGVLTEVERFLGLDDSGGGGGGGGDERRKRTLIRMDGGFGTDENLNWSCWRGYQFVAKGYSGKRAKKVAKSVPEDDRREGPTPGQLLGVPEKPKRYARKTETVARRWRDKRGKLHQDLLVTTLSGLVGGREEIAKLYDRRGAMEVDMKGDKRGLGLAKRKKRDFFAREALVLLARLAHNLAVWFERWFLAGTDAGELGMERLIREVMRMPGQVRVGRWSKKVHLKLPTLNTWAKAVAKGIRARYPPNGWRTILGEN